jgi:hypothetical protein
VAHQIDAAGIAAVARDIAGDPGHGAGAVLDEAGERHRRIEPVVGDHDDGAGPGQGLRNEAVVGAVALLPIAPVKEDDHRAVAARLVRHVDVEALPWIGTIGDVRMRPVGAGRRHGVQQAERCAGDGAEQAQTGDKGAPAAEKRACC